MSVPIKLNLANRYPGWSTAGWTPIYFNGTNNDTTLPISFYRSDDGTFSTDLDFFSLLPTGWDDPTTYIPCYVDPVSGNDTTGTGSATAPFRSISKAMGVDDAPYGNGTVGEPRVIYAKPGFYPRLYGWKGTNPVAHTILLPWPGYQGKIIISTRLSTAAGAYTATADTTSGVWLFGSLAGESSIAVANVYVTSEMAVDLDENGYGMFYTLATSLANCRATPKTYWVVEQGSTDVFDVYVNTGTPTINTDTLYVLRDSSNGVVVSGDDLPYSFYAQDVVLLGGSRPFYSGVNSGTAITQDTLAFSRCSFKFAYLNTAVRSGMTIEASKNVYLLDCDVNNTCLDGYSYKAWKQAIAAATFPSATPVYCNVLEIRCTGARCNTPFTFTDSSQIANVSTIHDYCRIIRVEPRYQQARGGVIHDTNIDTGSDASVIASLNLGARCADSAATGGTGAGNTDFAFAQTNVENVYAWLDGCGNVDRLGGNSTSTYYVRNLSAAATNFVYVGNNLFNNTPRQTGTILGLVSAD